MRNLFCKVIFLFSLLFPLFLLFSPSSFAQSYSSYYQTGYWPVGYSPLNPTGKNAYCSSNPCGIKTFDITCKAETFDATCAISTHAGCDNTGDACVKQIMNNPSAQCLSTNHPYGDTTDYSAYCGPLEYPNCTVYGCYGFQFYIPGAPAPPPTPTPTPTPTPEPCITYGTTGDYSYPNTCADATGFYTDNCTDNQSYTYYCNASNLCQLYKSPCGAGYACVVQSSNGLPVCVATSTPTPAPGVVAQEEQCNSAGTAWIPIVNVCVAPSACSLPPVPTPTPAPAPCQVTTFPSSHNNLVVGGAGGLIQAQVSSGQGTATIKRIRFGSYNTSISTANPTSDSSSPYYATASCIAGGNTAVWATADLSDGRICQSTGTTDTDIFCVAPTPTLTPSPSPTPTPVPGTVMIQGHFVDANNTFAAAGTRTITISGGALTSPAEPIYGLSPDNLWKKDSLTSSSANYFTAAASTVKGYDISYAVCPKNNTSCARIYAKANSVTLNYYLSNANDYADIYFKYIPTPCLVTASPGTYNLNVGGTAEITATVTDLPTGKTILQMLFGSYDTAVANVSPPVDPSSPYSTTVTADAVGNTAVWATAKLNGGDVTTCQSTGTTDTDINVFTSGSGGGGTPSPTSPPPPPPPILYSISGKIFSDANEDGKSAAVAPLPADANYTGAFSVTSTGGTVTYPAPTGSYLISNLASGQYTITFSGLPAGYSFTYPPLPLIVNIGAGCSVPVTSEALCSLGNIINLNAGVTGIAAVWIQTIGTDLRWDSGFNNPLPASSAYASIPGTGGMPGIIFSGNSSPSFGLGQASQNPFNWIVGGPSSEAREVFTDTHSLIPTSYRFLLETAEGSGIAKKGVADLCSGGSDSTNCTLTPALANGVYKIDGNLNLNGAGYTFPANKNFVVLINGNLNINEKIFVPVGSTAVFSAKGNITVNKTVGEATASAACDIASHIGCSIEGLYSADSNFVADGLKNCAVGADLKLNVAGSAIANAGRFGGTFVNNRTLCAGNVSNPAVSFTERPEFMLNYPSVVTQTSRAWQEIAP